MTNVFSVYVAKLVPNKPLKPIDINGHTGLQFDKYGDCLPYSILGTVEDYLQEIKAQGKQIVSTEAELIL